MLPGLYRVSATWTPDPNRASNAPYTILDGSTPLATVRVNQELAPNHFTANGVTWFNLGGTYNITGDTLVVRLTNDADEYVIADAVRVERLLTNPVQIRDNGDAGFSATGGFVSLAGQGHQNDVHFAAAGTGDEVASWTFTVTPGTYRISATWTSDPNRATNAIFTILNGSTVLANVSVNQELTPDDFSEAGTFWEDLGDGVYVITGNTLTVALSDLADEYVIADAIRIERLA